MKKILNYCYVLMALTVFLLVGCQTDDDRLAGDVGQESSFVDQNEAMKLAHDFLLTNGDVKEVRTRAQGGEPNLEMVYTDGTPSTRSGAGSRSNYYIINYDSGYVVVSASKGTYPVLGYSTEGRFNPDNIPVNMKDLLNGYAKEIQFAEGKVKIDQRIKEMRSTALAGTNMEMNAQTAVYPLLGTINWNQAPYYNYYCPPNTPVGCVATATSQIMRYWEYPSRGQGSHWYNSSYGTLSFDYNYPLNWSYMPKETLTRPNDDIARLCYGVAVGLNMNFSPSGSGAYQQDVPALLKEHFFYPSDVMSLERSDYSTTQWNSIVREELDKGHPVQYAGTGSGGGHSFVCDGYSNNGYFHINWGWGGSFNGYFLLNALDPSGLGIGGGSGGFNYWQTIVVNFAPPGGNGGNPDPEPDPEPTPNPSGDYCPSYSDNTNAGYIYYVSIGDMANYSGASTYTFFSDKNMSLRPEIAITSP